MPRLIAQRAKSSTLIGATCLLLMALGLAPLAASATLSADQQAAYDELFQAEAIPESMLPFSLRRAFDRRGFVLITFGAVPVSRTDGVPMRVEEHDFTPSSVRSQPTRTWSCIVASGTAWDELTNWLCQHAAHLYAVPHGKFDADGDLVTPIVSLLYHFPRTHFLDIGQDTLRLSPAAQEYLSLCAVSPYRAPRRVIIIEEPHEAVDRQFALLKGLEIFFADNPQILESGSVVFLAEGYPAWERLTVEPMVKAEPKPSDVLIKTVLETYLITGYVAYEWKHQRGIPIIGTEDPALYRMSARIWWQLQRGGSPACAVVWPQTVAARNASMAEVLLAHAKTHACPILFAGGRHLVPLLPHEVLDDDGWRHAREAADATDLARLRKADKRGIFEILQDHGLGYYFLQARGEVWPDEESERRATQRYARLFEAQVRGDLAGYVKQVTGRPAGSVTVAPSTQAAAQVVLADRRI